MSRYLARLDETRHYSNHGVLVDAFETRMAHLLGQEREAVAVTSSGTAALFAALLATAGRAQPDRPFCLVAGYGFVAAPLAAEQAGFRPYLVDIDPENWMVDPDRLAEHPMLGKAGAVIVTVPYGRKFGIAAWDAFTERTGVAVVIDAAAGLEAITRAPAATIGRTPVILSFHATKALGIGEGGAVVGTDPVVIRRVRAAINFGFDGTRETVLPGGNGKLSEYHAAVGLAVLDEWSERRAAGDRVAALYQTGSAGAGLRIWTSPAVSCGYVLFEASTADQARKASLALDAADIGNRFWYGQGLHRERYFADVARDPLPGTEQVATRMLGIPTSPDLSANAVAAVVAILARA